MRRQRVQCVCPECGTPYRVPPTAIGHRARCRTCGQAFRLRERAARLATEDDIIRWLHAAEEPDESAVEPQPAATAESTPDPDAEPDTGLHRKRLSA